MPPRKPTSTAAPPAAPLVGDPRQIAALEAAEARLGVRFPAAYRAFVADRANHVIGVKRMRMFRVARVHWLQAAAHRGVVIGWTPLEPGPDLVFRPARARGMLGDAVYAFDGAAFTRLPDFDQLVHNERRTTVLATDVGARLAQRLAGLARRCPQCGAELVIREVCACGHLGAPSDPPIEPSPADLAAHPLIARAHGILGALKAAGHAFPAGPAQTVALAAALAETATARAAATRLLAHWRERALPHALTATVLAAAIRG